MSGPHDADADVLIIGAGPTGAVAAKRFAEAGMRVVVLEQGDWPDYSKARANHLDFELTLGRYWSGNPNRRQAPAEYPIDDKDSDLSPVSCNALGWHWWPAPNAIATRAYGPLRPCTQRATCMWGCVEGAKGSVDVTHWPQNVRLGVQLVTGARVRRLETNGSGLVTGAAYVDR